MNYASLAVCERRTSPVVYAPCGTHPQVSVQSSVSHIKLLYCYKFLSHQQPYYSVSNTLNSLIIIPSTCFFLAISLRHSRSSCVCCSSLSLILLVSCCVNCIFFSFCVRDENGVRDGVWNGVWNEVWNGVWNGV